MKLSTLVNGTNTVGTMNSAILGIAASLFVMASPASAADKAPFDWKTCSEEIEKYCKDVKADDKIYACLEENQKKLDKTCQATEIKYEKANGIKPK